MKVRGITLIPLLVALNISLFSPFRANRTLTVFAASSLSDAFAEIAAAFKAEHPGVDIVYNFDASSTLAIQLKEGAPADVFASANEEQMAAAQKAGRIAGDPHTFARNWLVLAVPADNPAGIQSLHDLANPGVKLVVAGPDVPIRKYTEAMLNRLATLPDYGADYRTAVIKNIVSQEDNVRQVVVKLALGEADAGVVYQSDITPDMAPKLRVFPIPYELNTLATYPIAMTTNRVNRDVAQAYVDYVLSNEGQDILSKWGFVPVRLSPDIF